MYLHKLINLCNQFSMSSRSELAFLGEIFKQIWKNAPHQGT